jgi:hypothetical protein
LLLLAMLIVALATVVAYYVSRSRRAGASTQGKECAIPDLVNSRRPRSPREDEGTPAQRYRRWFERAFPMLRLRLTMLV